MKRLIHVTALLVVHSCIGITPVAIADDSLLVTAGVATVSIAPRPPGRDSMRLPSIEFAFSIEAICQDDWIAGSLSLSIADTRQNLSAQQMQPDSSQAIVVLVPEEQIAPLTIGDFCVDDLNARTIKAEPDQRIVRDVLSVQASLLCARDNQQKMTYVSHPLDIRLTCEHPQVVPSDDATES